MKDLVDFRLNLEPERRPCRWFIFDRVCGSRGRGARSRSEKEKEGGECFNKINKNFRLYLDQCIFMSFSLLLFALFYRNSLSTHIVSPTKPICLCPSYSVVGSVRQQHQLVEPFRY